jgi:hypothetical protein
LTKNKVKFLLIIISAFTIGFLFPKKFIEPKRIGITLWESETRKAGNDLILVAPIHGDFKEDWKFTNVYLMNLEGNTEYTWKISGVPLSNRIGPDGLLYSIILTSTNAKKTTTRGEANKISATNLQGNEVWSVELSDIHHDFDFVENDKLVTLQYKKIDRNEINLIDPHSKLEIGYSDKVIVVNRSGNIEWTWDLMDHIKELKFNTMKFNSTKAQMIDEESFNHLNSISYNELNPISNKPAFLISSRRLNMVILLEYPSGKILWQSSPEELSRQHDATIKDHLVTVFNNNINDGEPMNVQVWDVRKNLKVKEWSLPNSYLTSQLMGGARWLSDGSLLISISTSGSLLEVDPAGIMSWSFIFNDKAKFKTPVWEIGQNFFRAEVYKRSILKTLK